MRYAFLAVVFVLVGSCEVQAQRRAIICPPQLSYCYEKPILPQKTVEDEIAELEARLRSYRAEGEFRSRMSDIELRYQLLRSW